MSYQPTYPLQNQAISSFPINDELILFDNNSKQLALLNQTASEIWDFHKAELSLDEIIKQISKKYGLAKSDISDDVSMILEQWFELGFIGDSKNKNDIDDEKKLFDLKNTSALDINTLNLLHCKTFRYLDSTFSIHTSNADIQNIIKPVISHFNDAETPPDTHQINIVQIGNSFEILSTDKVIAKCDSLIELAPIINSFILITGYQEVDCLSVFHAGAVSDDNGVVLLSGSPGSGKSTLVTALMCSVSKVFTDEVSVLTYDKKIRPAPGCIGLKEGSWNVIEEFYPNIINSPIHLRQDDKVVKYIPPKKLPNNTQQIYGELVKAIVFPIYSQDYVTNINEISSGEALVRLTNAGYYTGQTLNTKTVTDLIAWVHEIPTYELQINNLNEAVELVTELL